MSTSTLGSRRDQLRAEAAEERAQAAEERGERLAARLSKLGEAVD